MFSKKHKNQIDEIVRIISSDEEANLDSIITARVHSKPFIFQGKSEDLHEHISKISSEFSKCSALTLYNASLIVAIRRQLHIETNLERFDTLWQSHHKVLLNELNLRWIVSTCDTISDYGSKSERALSTATSFLVNTVKLYETERDCSSKKDAPLRENDFYELFDGLTSFKIGGGDMIKNLTKRVGNLDDDSISSKLFMAATQKILLHNTVYGRLEKVQTKNKWSTDVSPK
ncbi:hypothetical protein [Rubritalea sp.]|uniref:hypothetical protein n=1 Tax=Rubritalea sp. TaxID=2109375 RepID=UPI003EF9700A